MTERFFQGGGSLPANLPSYIERDADGRLENLIKDNYFCYILTPRQMGKSSLRVRISKKLEQQGFACVSIDISEIGVNNLESADQWFFTLLSMLVKRLKLEKKILSDWWKENIEVTPVNRFYSFLSEKVIELTSGQIVIFLDEIDSILSIDKRVFNSDDFFACIRSIYNGRADNPALNRINIVVIGVASPNDLMNDPARTPFNVGYSVQLYNFTLRETEVLKEGLKNLMAEPDVLLKKIFYWTNGQPVLTQKLCLSISREKTGLVTDIPAFVKNHVNRLFLKNSIGDSNNDNLLNIQNRIERDEKFGLQILDAYKRILSQGSIKEVKRDLPQIYLKLTGLAHSVNGLLKINNRIYKTKFNVAWADDIWNKINRPFNASLKGWIDSNKSGEKVLRDQELIDYNNWCYSRNDLTHSEREFQDQSNHVKILEESILKLREEFRENIVKIREESIVNIREELPDQLITRFFEDSIRNSREKFNAQMEEGRETQEKKEVELELPEKVRKLQEELQKNADEKETLTFSHNVKIRETKRSTK